MAYDFLVETYATERVKVVSVWSEFHDADLPFRPNPSDSRGRSVCEQMVHQCVSEDLWFCSMLGIDVSAPPLPKLETRLEFIKRYAEDSGKRLGELRTKSRDWWEGNARFLTWLSPCLDHDPPSYPYLSSSWPANGHAAHAWPQPAQQLRADRGHRRPDAELCSNHLRLF
jgi:hypothetical protein